MTPAGSGPAAPAGDPARAEFPPAQYWRRWGTDAAPPVAVASESRAEPVRTPVAASTAADGEAPFRVLVVEDDLSQALFAESVLSGAGMQAAVV
ncbi:MAG TPA: GGDEF domain-containing response regulator, partial [Luteimonas sp.]|nr:GGDEF domain-containing response regulator [Luteimonas sp.]